MIRKVRGKEQWNIYSKSGDKKLNKTPFRSKKAAQKRLAQIEHFADQPKSK